MHKWSDSPIVTFSRNGQAIELGRSGEAPVLHVYGSTGLGVAPVDISKSDRITGDGSVVRGIRYSDRELFIPLFVEQPSTGDLNLWRRELTRLLAPRSGDPAGSLVDVTITDPSTGTNRTARGIYTDGLAGDYSSDYYGNWQTLGVTFDCSDPWWLGPERGKTLRLDPGSKPFLSEGKIWRRNLVPNPLGPGAENTDWWRSIRGDFTLVDVDAEPAGHFVKTGESGQGYVDPSINFRPPAESTLRFSAEVRVGSDLDMRLRVAAYYGAQPTMGDAVAQTPADGWVRHEVVVPVTAMPEGGYLRTLVWPSTMDPGDQFWVRRVLVEVDTTGDYFDGDSSGCKWVGGSQGPESVMWDPTTTTPFFPVVLAQSAVVGEFTIDVGGDGPVYPAWEIHGPGEDLRIVRGKDRIAIDGTLRKGETILVDAATGRIVPDVWDDVSEDTSMFPLDPGTHTLTVTMVGATTDTQVRLTYRERYLEGV